MEYYRNLEYEDDGWCRLEAKYDFEIEIDKVNNTETHSPGVTDEDYFYRDLKDVIKHDDLFKAYPRIKDLRVFFMNVDNRPEASLCTNESGKIFIICNLKYEREFSDDRGSSKKLGEESKRYNTLRFRRILAHELQHAIQVNEGLSEGGSKGFELDKLKNEIGSIHNLTKEEQENIATRRYLNKAGEIEARSADARVDLSSSFLKQQMCSLFLSDMHQISNIVAV
jgi:hypothetical protein